ncbi:hypothetical protein KA005_04940 [bacterium]|nr:hypothetical protein [bacterium]
MNQLDSFTPMELTVGKGVETIKSLPCVAPWLSPFGVCLINITSVRRNEFGVVEFQLGDESAVPYKTKNGEAWVEADAFYPEWPD